MLLRTGPAIVGLAIIHTVVGVVLGLAPLAAIAGDGFVNAVGDDQYDRMAIVWFLFAGFAVIPFGQLVAHIEAKGIELPKVIVWELVGLALLGVVLMPVSGFWLVFAYVAYRYASGRPGVPTAR